MVLAAAPAWSQTKPAAPPAPAPAAQPSGAAGLLGQGSGAGPVAIDAVNGIEWDRDGKRYVARGDAKAVRGGVTVYADTLVARYRDASENPAHVGQPKPAKPAANGDAAASSGAGAGTDIWRVEAIGKVRIVTANNETATGDRAVYDVDQDVLVLNGKNLRLVTPTQTVTARDSLEYWQGRKVAVARGDAVAVEKDRRIQADSLTAHMGEDPNTHSTKIVRVDGFGHVRVSTEKEVATGDKGVYDLITNIAVLVGDVKVTQDKNQMNGDYAEVNMTTGIAKMKSGGDAGGKAGARVRALLTPPEHQGPQPPTGAPAPGPEHKKPGGAAHKPAPGAPKP